jgi:hypothetical protein
MKHPFHEFATLYPGITWHPAIEPKTGTVGVEQRAVQSRKVLGVQIIVTALVRNASFMRGPDVDHFFDCAAVPFENTIGTKDAISDFSARQT